MLFERRQYARDRAHIFISIDDLIEAAALFVILLVGSHGNEDALDAFFKQRGKVPKL